MKTSFEIRKEFLDYFQKKNHTAVESSPLIPQNDPTLLFTNAGMVQFKGVFLGEEKRDYTRATSSQKCVRAGGKHNDLENVGRTARHHTFFEMLGNFSFGDYFKEEAITMAWEFLTRNLNLPKEKLWVSVFREDQEAASIWRDTIGMDPDRIVAMGEKDNFWAMGETGPCGPCSEIIIDQGHDFSCGKPECQVGCDCDRYLELWNLVFMQFNRDANGTRTPLPRPSIDTGMGLERITAVVQGVRSNYDTDLFLPLIGFVEKISRKRYREHPEQDTSMRIIADHSRAIAFLIGDGVLPSNEGRGYVLRRIMRRAARHGKKLGLVKPFLHEAVKIVAEEMKGAYPEVLRAQDYITRVVFNEEENFSATLEAGLRILQDEVERLQQKKIDTIPGSIVFKLYDTYGFPVDLTQDIASEYRMRADEEGFQQAMQEQRKRARESWKGSGEEQIAGIYKKLVQDGIRTAFNGYESTGMQTRVLAIIRNGERVERALQGEEVELVTADTCFYGEAGGQVGDSGTMTAEQAASNITNTTRPLPELIVHRATIVRGSITRGDGVSLTIDTHKRQATANNHTATHILHAVLRELLGNHVKQAGSLVSPERLRFDFTHFAALTREELDTIEKQVNDRIRQNKPLSVTVLPIAEAIAMGATALFGEKYGEQVRVVRIADYSMELCGGTHNRSTGEIGIFKIVSEGGVAAGVRRIEAVTGQEALRFIGKQDEMVRNLYQMLKTDREGILAKAERMIADQKEMEKEIAALKSQLIAKESGNILDTVRTIGGVKVLVTMVHEGDVKSLREYGDTLKDRLGSGVIVLGAGGGGTAQLLAMVTRDVANRFSAKRIIENIAPLIDGRGGGKNEMAQAGGKHPEHVEEALQKAWSVIEEMGTEG
ncbi:MAG: alanine--tRNA ligase [Proteobacteria bacterium]|nr:alanine--tRNA ligase [Pseudomonadota bacterium]